MADAAVVIKQGNTLVVLSKIHGADGAAITQSGLAALSWRLVDEDGAEIVAASLTISSQVYNTSQTWTFPNGQTFSYNFKHIISGGNFATGGKSYQAQYLFTDTASYPYRLVVDVKAEDLL